MGAPWDGTSGIFTLLGKQIQWFNQLGRLVNGASFSSGANQFKSLDRQSQELASATKNTESERDQIALIGATLGTQKAAIRGMRRKVRGSINELLKGIVRDKIDGKRDGDREVAEDLAIAMSASAQTINGNVITVSAISTPASNYGNGPFYTHILDISGTVNEAIWPRRKQSWQALKRRPSACAGK